MKRIYAFGLFLTMLLGLSFTSKAELSVTITCDTPQGLDPRGETTDSDAESGWKEIVVSTTEGSQTISIDKTYGTLRIWPADGYYFTGYTTTKDESGLIAWQKANINASLNPGSFKFAQNKANGIAIDMQTYNGETIDLTVAEIERNDVLTVEVVNGLTNIKTFQFSDGYAPELKKGINTIKYNHELSNKITLEFTGSGEPYPVDLKFNNEAPSDLYSAAFTPAKPYNHSYSIKVDATRQDNYLYIKVFENEEEEPDTWDLNITYSAGMEKSLSSLFDRNTSKQYRPSDYEEGYITGVQGLLDGSEIRFNFRNEDCTITDVKVNGVSKKNEIEDEGDNVNQSYILTITEDTTVEVIGTATEWADIVYTGYVSDPDGVLFGLELSDDPDKYTLHPTIGSDVSGQKFGVLTMPEGSKQITVTVSEKNNHGHGTFYFMPKEGYFISKAYVGTPNDATTESGTRFINSAIGMDENLGFYMIVEKMDPEFTADLKVVSYSSGQTLKSADTYTEQNANRPRREITLTPSEEVQTLSFVPNYDNPFTLYSMVNTIKVYLDGAEVSGALNGDSNQYEYALPLHAPATGETSDVHSEIDVLFEGAHDMSTVNLDLKNGAQAEFYYHPVMHKIDGTTQTVKTGTLMTVKPTSANAVLLVDGKAQELDENGHYQFEAAPGASVTVTAPQSINIAGMVPSAGSTVASLSGVSLLVPMSIDEQEVNMDIVPEILNQTVVTLNNETVATMEPINMDEFEMTGDEAGNMIVPIKFNKKITEAGNYYIVVPAGAFVQKVYDDATDSMVVAPGGYSTLAYNGRMVVDPSYASPLEDITLSPADGETVGEIDVVTLVFNQLPAESMGNSWEWQNATFTKDDKTIEAIVILDWNYPEDNIAFSIKPINEDEEATPITEPGTWTMTIAAGTFTEAGEQSPEFTATYTIVAPAADYEVSPANGATVDNLSEVKITFPGVETVEYNDEVAITLEGPDSYKVTSTDVHGTGNEWSVSFRNPTVEGEYTLTFPAGAFTLDGEASKETVVSYVYEQAWKVSPASGSTVESLDEMTLTFPNATEVEFVGEPYAFSISDPGQSFALPGMICEKVEGADVPTFKLTIPAGAGKIPNGTVYFTVEEGAFEIDGVASPEMMATYTMDAPVTTEYEITPDGTIIIEDYMFFGFIFDERVNVTTPKATDVTLTLDDEVISSEDYMVGAEGFGLSFMFTNISNLHAGTLKVTIPAGAFYVGELSSPAIDQEWTLVEPKVFEPVISFEGANDANKVSDLSVIYISFPDATTGKVYDPFGAAASLMKTDYSYRSEGATIEVVENQTRATGVTFAIKFTPAPTEEGTYKFELRDGSLILDGVYPADGIEETYVLDYATGIESIYADENGNVTVYTLDGRVVLNNVPAAQLRELENGLYIINGKKTLVK